MIVRMLRSTKLGVINYDADTTQNVADVIGDRWIANKIAVVPNYKNIPRVDKVVEEKEIETVEDTIETKVEDVEDYIVEVEVPIEKATKEDKKEDKKETAKNKKGVKDVSN